MIVGVEVSRETLRGVCLSRPRPGAPARQAATAALEAPLDLDSGDASPLARAVSQLMTRLGNPKGPVAVAIPSDVCFRRAAFFPFRSSSRAMRALGYTLEDRLPGAVGDYILEPGARLRPSGKRGSRMMVAACPEQRLALVLDAFRQAGVDPCVVQTAGMALAAYAYLAIRPKPKGPTLVTRLDGDACEIALVEKGELLDSRLVPLGALDSSRKDPGAAIADRIVFAARAGELGHGSTRPSRALVLAPPETAESLRGWLKHGLQLSVEALPQDAPDAEFAAAWGVAASASRGKHAAPSLRRGRHVYPPYAARLPRRVAALLALCVAAICLMGVHTWRAADSARQALRRDQRSVADLFRKTLGFTRAPPSVRAFRAALTEARKKAGQLEQGRGVSCLRRWVELMDLTPKGSHIRFLDLQISQRRIAMKFNCPDTRQVWAFRKRLQSSGTFLPNAPVQTGNPDSKHTTFTMELRYRR